MEYLVAHTDTDGTTTAITSLAQALPGRTHMMDLSAISDIGTPDLQAGESTRVLFYNIGGGEFSNLAAFATLKTSMYLWSSYHLYAKTIGDSCILSLDHLGEVCDATATNPSTLSPKILVTLFANCN
ncbi:MAG: hypothetical protein R3Y56_02285 [Akkermansia sp.]